MYTANGDGSIEFWLVKKRFVGELIIPCTRTEKETVFGVNGTIGTALMI